MFVSIVGIALIFFNSIQMTIYITNFPYSLFVLDILALIVYFFVSVNNVSKISKLEEKDMKIITLTLNPAFDIHCYTEHFLPFHENLAEIVRVGRTKNYYYYVLLLADNLSKDPSCYIPDTLAERLNKLAAVSVKEAENGDPIAQYTVAYLTETAPEATEEE